MHTISNPPRVSGIMAARNATAFVGAAIESVLGQTYTDFELLVVDDASTDGTAEMVAGYARSDARVRLLRQTERQGQCAARNLAMKEARGEWIAVLDADDLWRPTRLERQVAVMEENPRACLITSDFQFITQAGLPLDVVHCPWPEWWLRWCLLFGNAIGGHSQVLFRRDAALACGGYREDRKPAEDYQLWTDLIERGSVAYSPGVEMDYRRHDGAESAINLDVQTRNARQTSDQALTALLGEAWTKERLARMRDFWSVSVPARQCRLTQISRDLHCLENAFWRRHPGWRTTENRKLLAGHVRWHWASLAGRFREQGFYGKALIAWSLGFGCRLERLRLRFAATAPASASAAAVLNRP